MGGKFLDRRCIVCGGSLADCGKVNFFTCSQVCRLEAKRAKARRKAASRRARGHIKPSELRQQKRKAEQHRLARLALRIACLVCGKPIKQKPTAGPLQRICSDACRRQRAQDRYKKLRRQRFCITCSRPIDNRNRLYCSTKCRPPPYKTALTANEKRAFREQGHALYVRQKAAYQIVQQLQDIVAPIKFCEICGTPIPRLSRRTVFCSNECQRRTPKRGSGKYGPRERERARLRHLGLLEPRPCIVCFQDVHGRGATLYCSQMCRNAVQPREKKRSRESKKQKAKRTHALYVKMRAADQYIQALKARQ